MIRRSKTGKNTHADNRSFSFRLDNRIDRERRARELLTEWTADAAKQGKTLRDVIVALVLHYSNDDSWKESSSKLGQVIEERFHQMEGNIRVLLESVLMELRKNPQKVIEFIDRKDGDNDDLDRKFIGNLLENLDR